MQQHTEFARAGSGESAGARLTAPRVVVVHPFDGGSPPTRSAAHTVDRVFSSLPALLPCAELARVQSVGMIFDSQPCEHFIVAREFERWGGRLVDGEAKVVKRLLAAGATA